MTINWLDREFVSAFTLDDNGVAALTPTETFTEGDSRVTIRGKYGSVTTPNASWLDLPLPWAVASGGVWGIEAYVTVKSATATTRRKIKVSALVYGVGTVATLDAAPDVDVKGTGTPSATIFVDGATSAIYLRLMPGTAAAYTWGFEIRAQQL